MAEHAAANGIVDVGQDAAGAAVAVEEAVIGDQAAAGKGDRVGDDDLAALVAVVAVVLGGQRAFVGEGAKQGGRAAFADDEGLAGVQRDVLQGAPGATQGAGTVTRQGDVLENAGGQQLKGASASGGDGTSRYGPPCRAATAWIIAPDLYRPTQSGSDRLACIVDGAAKNLDQPAVCGCDGSAVVDDAVVGDLQPPGAGF